MKKILEFEIPFRLPGLNEYIRQNRANKHAGNNEKQKIEQSIIWILKSLKSPILDKPVYVKFIWHEKTKRRDKDNVAFAKKFILDALQKSGILPNDNNKYILGFQDEFIYNKMDKIVVEILETDMEE